MTSLYDKWSETEKITHTKLNYSNKLPLKEQVLFEHKNVKLLNVSKTYCNNLYIGVNFLFSVKKDLLKIFKPTDTGYTESLVDNLSELIKYPHFIHTMNKIYLALVNTQEISVKTFTFSFNNLNITCEKVYIDDVYSFSNFRTGRLISRGAYSGKTFSGGSSYDNMLCSGDDNKEIVNYYKKRSSIGLSNIYTYVSTKYSNIRQAY